MKHFLIGLTTSLAISGASIALAQDPAAAAAQTQDPAAAAAQRPGTHVESTITGDARVDDPSAPVNGLDNDHHFEAGAPHLTEMASFLDLSARQKAQLTDIIERGDAGAAVLIKREHDVKDMLAKTKPEDPMYADLIREQASAPARWQAARDNVHQEIRGILTPAQQAKFEQLQAQRQSSSRQ